MNMKREAKSSRGAVATVMASTASPEDVQAITQACHDYFEAWYTADAKRMENCLHPNLAKRSIVRDPENGEWKLDHDDATTMVALTREGRGTKRAPEDERWVDVTIRDVYGRIASATVISYPYVEYIHLAKFRDRWRIVNAIWEWRDGYVPPV